MPLEAAVRPESQHRPERKYKKRGEANGGRESCDELVT
jgi:hypothetical protein